MKTWFTRRLLIAAGALMLAAPAFSADKPKSIIHVVTLYFKAGASDADKKKVLDGVDEMGKKIPGIKNVWLKSIKVQGDAGGTPLTTAFVMEFVDEAAFKAYDNHPAHRAWEKIYIPVRGESRTHDITN